MMTYNALFKADFTRRIDAVIDYFGEGRKLSAGRKTWLTRSLGSHLRCRRREHFRVMAMR
jgi:hypothetical protein